MVVMVQGGNPSRSVTDEGCWFTVAPVPWSGPAGETSFCHTHNLWWCHHQLGLAGFTSEECALCICTNITDRPQFIGKETRIFVMFKFILTPVVRSCLHKLRHWREYLQNHHQTNHYKAKYVMEFEEIVMLLCDMIAQHCPRCDLGWTLTSATHNIVNISSHAGPHITHKYRLAMVLHSHHLLPYAALNFGQLEVWGIEVSHIPRIFHILKKYQPTRR